MAQTDIISPNIILDLIKETIKAKALTDIREDEVYLKCIEACKPIVVNGNHKYEVSQICFFLDNFFKTIENRDGTFIHKPRGRMFELKDVIEFAESQEYLGQRGSLWPKTKEDLWEVFHGINDDGTSKDYMECVFGGSIGGGKTYKACIGLLYLLYDLSSYYSPQVEFGLAPGSPIVFIQQSRTFTLALKVVFEELAAMIRESPYFTKFFPFNPQVHNELRFPKNIYVRPVAGSHTGAMSQNVWGGILDELNFMLRTKDSMELQFSGEDEYDQAEKNYSSFMRRMESRFMTQGKIPGKVFLLSSANYPGDFIDRKAKEAKEDPRIFVSMAALWDAIPKSRLSPGRFYVELGTDTTAPRILASKEMAREGAEVIEVPEDYRRSFERDLDGALKDIAGRPAGTHSNFIPFRDKIELAQREHEDVFNNQSLFLMEECSLSELFPDESPEYWGDLINLDYIKEYVNDAVKHACHIDVGFSGATNRDSAGFVVGHVGGFTKIDTLRHYDENTGGFVDYKNVEVPSHHIDGALRLSAPHGGEVDLVLLSSLILFLHEAIGIEYVTMDTYQHRMLITTLRKGGIKHCGPLSVDTNIAPYAELRNAIRDERILFPRHGYLTQELSQLQRTMQSNNRPKIDHPSGGSKDISDALAGCVYILHRKVARFGSTSRMSRADRLQSITSRSRESGRRKRETDTATRRSKSIRLIRGGRIR